MTQEDDRLRVALCHKTFRTELTSDSTALHPTERGTEVEGETVHTGQARLYATGNLDRARDRRRTSTPYRRDRTLNH